MDLQECFHSGIPEAGCDEAGRGCLAGPVVAAAVILPPGWNHPWLRDSKRMSEPERDHLRPLIEQEALAWAVAFVPPEDIDHINILQASIQAMHLAVSRLAVRPEHLLIDGNRFRPFLGIPHTCIVGGDGRFRAIAAASVLAKTHRDELMERLHRSFPVYGWSENKGYPTPAHQEALLIHGPSPAHRRTFRLRGISIGDRFPD